MEIYKKLAKVKEKIGKISKDSTNPFYKSKYFDVNSLLEHVEPLLHDNGLLLLQPINNGCVTTEIIDIETGEMVSSGMDLTDIKDPQKRGSEVTYYRRYTLTSLLGLQAEDDDANKTVPKPQATEKPEVVWLSKQQFETAMQSDVKGITATLSAYSGNGKAMKKDYREQLAKKLKEIQGA